MRQLLSRLDHILRGDATHPDALKGGKLDVPAGGLVLVVLALGMLYGLCMGSYSLLKEIPSDVGTQADRYWQLLATTVKVPALFFLTLAVTFPSLYVFNALVGSRLRIINVLRLLIASLSVNLAVLASLGPIVAFFSVTTKSYPFVLLLNVLVFAVAGVLGLVFLLQTLHRLTRSASFDDSHEPRHALGENLVSPDQPGGAESRTDPSESDAPLIADLVEPDAEPSALDMPSGQVLGRHTRLVFGAWVCVFSLVGAQMGWVLRPFVGSPNMPFTWFRERESNFFEAVLRALESMLTGG